MRHGSESPHSPRDSDYLDRMIAEPLAADFTGYSVRALQNWRVRGGGPKFVRVSSRSVRYRRRDLIAWAEQRLVSNPSTRPPKEPEVQREANTT
jgi:predicted DNA-binding transcriptional regulator AlpA